MNYCYARVSTVEQNLDRQIAAFEPFKPYYLYQDKESGKDFNRPNYQKLKKKLKSGDTLIVLSLDRFGRNYDQIKEEWSYLTNKGVKIKIIDMPIIDTTNDDLTSKLISDIVINLLSYVAQTEREMILKRLNAGIKAAKERGVKFGRPEIELPSNFIEVATQYKNKQITNIEACELLNMSRGTFFRLLKVHNLERVHEPKKPMVEKHKQQCEINITNEEVFLKYKSGEINIHTACELSGFSKAQFYRLVNKYGYKREKKMKVMKYKPMYEVHYCGKTKTLNIHDLLEELDISRPTLRKYLNGGHTIINTMDITIIKK